MFDRFKTTLVTLLRNVLRINLKMTSSWIPQVLPPMPEHITTYCQRLAAMKKGERIALLKGWQVIGIKAYKFKRSSSQHEYLSVTVVDPKNKTSYVAREGMWNESDELICEFNIKKLLCLYELAFLALIVHEANTSYLLKTNNCYHYVGTIMKVLAEEYGTLNPVEGAGAGEWCGLVIYSGKEASMGVTLDYLVEGFKNVVKKFVSFVPIISS